MAAILAKELASACCARKTDVPDISDVVTKAIAGLSDRKAVTRPTCWPRTVSQLEAKPGVFERARTVVRRPNASS